MPNSLFGRRGCFFSRELPDFSPTYQNQTNMKSVKLTSVQHAWICCKMSESYRKAQLDLQDYRKPSTVSFYERYDAMDNWHKAVAELERHCEFLQSLAVVMMGKEAQL